MGSKTKKLKVACVQMCATKDIDRNTRLAKDLTAGALEAGAKLVVLPERFSAPRDGADMSRDASSAQERLCEMADLARRHKAFIVAGSVPTNPRSGRFLNRTSVFNPQGALEACYDKINLFKARLPTGKQLDESIYQRPGRRKVTFKAYGFQVGLAICFDLRFPELFRNMSADGAEVFAAPSAFTAATGALHWELLARSRAIDSQSYIIAANQCGKSPAGVAQYGHSIIVDPFGRIVDIAGSKQCFITGKIDGSLIVKARNAMKIF